MYQSQYVKVLYDLQATDLALIKLQTSYVKAKKIIDANGGLNRLEQTHEKAKADTLSAKVKLARVKSTMAEILDRDKALEKRLYDGTITKTRELKALEMEQVDLRRQLAIEQEKLAPYNDEIEAYLQVEADLEEQIATKKSSWQEQKPKYEQQMSECATQFKGKQDLRKQYVEQIPPDLLKVYEQLFRATKGSAVVQIDRGVCQGCYIMLPLGNIDDSQNSQNLLRCSNCTRLIVFS